MLFATSVSHAQTMAALLELRGIPARAISGQTPPAARRHYIQEFREGKIRVLTNFNVLTIGFDAPAVRCVLVARPVYTPGLYQQIIGRGLRGPANGGKDECLIIDVVDNITNYDGQLAFRGFEYLWNDGVATVEDTLPDADKLQVDSEYAEREDVSEDGSTAAATSHANDENAKREDVLEDVLSAANTPEVHLEKIEFEKVLENTFSTVVASEMEDISENESTTVATAPLEGVQEAPIAYNEVISTPAVSPQTGATFLNLEWNAACPHQAQARQGIQSLINRHALASMLGYGVAKEYLAEYAEWDNKAAWRAALVAEIETQTLASIEEPESWEGQR